MLQSISFPVAGSEILAILHLPDRDAVGGMAVLLDRGMPYEDPDVLLTCNALADSGVAALRFEWRSGRQSLDEAVADVAAGLRLLKAHPALPGSIGVGGFGFGSAIAASAAGRDSRVKVAVLVGARAEIEGSKRPLTDLSRTRARVLLVRAAGDETDRYVPVLSQARVTHRASDPLPRDRMVREIAKWSAEAFDASGGTR